jgi:hypothetical protein
MLGEATLDVSGTSPGEAIRLLTLIAAPQKLRRCRLTCRDVNRQSPRLCELVGRRWRRLSSKPDAATGESSAGVSVDASACRSG